MNRPQPFAVIGTGSGGADTHARPRSFSRRRAIRHPGYSIEYDSWYIPCTQGVIALVDADMVPILAQRKWQAHRCGNRWIAKRKTAGRCMFMHRVVAKTASHQVTDHRKYHAVDLKVIDNRRANLRSCSSNENNYNSRPQMNTTSGFKGVRWHKSIGKWVAGIKVDGRSIHLGTFTDEVEAARAYDAAAIQARGEFAYVNGV